MYTAPNHISGTVIKIAVYLFNAKRKSGVTSRPVLPGAQATFLRRMADLDSNPIIHRKASGRPNPHELPGLGIDHD